MVTTMFNALPSTCRDSHGRKGRRTAAVGVATTMMVVCLLVLCTFRMRNSVGSGALRLVR